MSTMQILSYTLAAIAAVLVVAYFLTGNRQRRRGLQRLTAPMGLTLQGSADALQTSGLLESSVFKREDGRSDNILAGEVRSAEVLVFEYSVREGNRWRIADPVAFFRLKESKLPSFELRPRSKSDDPTGLAFEGHDRFSDIYALQGSDEAALRALFAEQILTFFVRSENQDWAVVSKGEWLGVTIWPLGRRPYALEPKQIGGFIEDAKQVLFLLSDSVK